jgi:hypothetical protein
MDSMEPSCFCRLGLCAMEARALVMTMGEKRSIRVEESRDMDKKAQYSAVLYVEYTGEDRLRIVRTRRDMNEPWMYNRCFGPITSTTDEGIQVSRGRLKLEMVPLQLRTNKSNEFDCPFLGTRS